MYPARSKVLYHFYTSAGTENAIKEVPPLPSGYNKHGEEENSWYKEKGLEVYLKVLFPERSEFWFSTKPDYMVSENFNFWAARYQHEMDFYEPRRKLFEYDFAYFKNPDIKYEWDWKESVLYGGYEGFFAQGAKVLELGSGMGKFVNEANEKYSSLGIQVFGVDYRYHNERPTEPNSALIGADFKSLPFPDNSFDRLLSHNAFPFWLPTTKGLMFEYFKEISRISKDGALW